VLCIPLPPAAGLAKKKLMRWGASWLFLYSDAYMSELMTHLNTKKAENFVFSFLLRRERIRGITHINR
jgi:hypothetical protein